VDQGPVDAVFIDFYGTICAGDRHAVETACARIASELALPLSAQALAVRWGERFFRTIEASNGARFRTLFACECDSLRQTLASLGRPGVDPEPFVADITAYWRDPPLHDDAADAVAALLALGVPTCCVSNADRADLEQAMARHGLKFDAVVTSEDARSYKPDEAIFHRAAAELGVLLRRVLHVGDSLHSDIGGAAPLGIRTAWIRRPDRILDIGEAVPDHTLSSLAELQALV